MASYVRPCSSVVPFSLTVYTYASSLSMDPARKLVVNRPANKRGTNWILFSEARDSSFHRLEKKEKKKRRRKTVNNERILIIFLFTSEKSVLKSAEKCIEKESREG